MWVRGSSAWALTMEQPRRLAKVSKPLRHIKRGGCCPHRELKRQSPHRGETNSGPIDSVGKPKPFSDRGLGFIGAWQSTAWQSRAVQRTAQQIKATRQASGDGCLSSLFWLSAWQGSALQGKAWQRRERQSKAVSHWRRWFIEVFSLQRTAAQGKAGQSSAAQIKATREQYWQQCCFRVVFGSVQCRATHRIA